MKYQPHNKVEYAKKTLTNYFIQLGFSHSENVKEIHSAIEALFEAAVEVAVGQTGRASYNELLDRTAHLQMVGGPPLHPCPELAPLNVYAKAQQPAPPITAAQIRGVLNDLPYPLTFGRDSVCVHIPNDPFNRFFDFEKSEDKTEWVLASTPPL